MQRTADTSTRQGLSALRTKGEGTTVSAQDSEQTFGDAQDSEQAEQQQHRSGDSAGDVELSEQGREEVEKMAEAYRDKPTAVLPGPHGTITGTAVNDWLDDEGNPKFGDPDEHPYAEGGDDSSYGL
jgi:hypothetical protein